MTRSKPSSQPIKELAGTRILVMGLGLHGGGVGITRWLVGQGARVTVTDLKTEEQLAASVSALSGLPVNFALGRHDPALFTNTDLVLRNPGVPAESPYLNIAREHGVPVVMEMGLFFELCPAPVLAITGTKGKTTTTSLLAAMIRRSRPDTVVAGNLAGGVAQWHGALPALELLPLIGPDTPVVLELSSWQLEGLPKGAAPHIACVTNISPDHLNRYASFADYAASKKAIFRDQRARDTLVLNYDNDVTCSFATEAPGQVAWFSRQAAVQGAFLNGTQLRWEWQGKTAELADVADIQMPGDHSLENVLAAAAVAMVFGVKPLDIRQAIREFAGVPHRLELVATVNGVKYINDSAATTPDASAAALAALASKSRVVLIAGGSDKGLSFASWAQSAGRLSKAIVLLDGAATGRMAAALREAGAASLVTGRCGDLASAVDQARKLAQPGDTILLSPACASFGMFANEFQRGDQFRQLVKGIPVS